MKEEDKTKQQLINELVTLWKRITELEDFEFAENKQWGLAIRERAARLETMGEQYVPFANRLHESARSFEEKTNLGLDRTVHGRRLKAEDWKLDTCNLKPETRHDKSQPWRLGVSASLCCLLVPTWQQSRLGSEATLSELGGI